MNELHYEFVLKPYRSVGILGQKSTLYVLFTLLILVSPPVVMFGSKLLFAFLISPVVMLLLAFFYFNREMKMREYLTITKDRLYLLRVNPDGSEHSFETDPYWVKIELKQDGPVPKYLTLSDHNRSVELGAFLPVNERVNMYNELKTIQNQIKTQIVTRT